MDPIIWDSQLDLAPWCYKWDGLDGMDILVGLGIEHLTVPINMIGVIEIILDNI